MSTRRKKKMRHEVEHDSHDGEWNPRKLLSVGVVVFLLVIAASMLGMVVEKIDADQILVIQDPLDGELHFYTDAGVKWQGFGKTTVYPKRAMYTFTCTEYKDMEQSAEQKARG
ncbi:hypothetical protein C4553_00335, partial [Candidatus Parcubacteria bacterium]